MQLMFWTSAVAIAIAVDYVMEPPATYAELLTIRICGSITTLLALTEAFTLLKGDRYEGN